jgi:hypothetical protein
VHNEVLHNSYSSPIKIRNIRPGRMRWAGHVAQMREKFNVYKLLVRKPEGNRPLGRPKRRRIDRIKMDLLVIGLGGVDWINLAQDSYSWAALVNAIMTFRVPYNAGKLPSGCTTCGHFSGAQASRKCVV